MTDGDPEKNEESFRDWATKESLINPIHKEDFIFIYRFWTTLTQKRLMVTKNWEETKEAIQDWIEMDRDLGMAVRGRTMGDDVEAGIQEIKVAIEMMEEKKKEGEI